MYRRFAIMSMVYTLLILNFCSGNMFRKNTKYHNIPYYLQKTVGSVIKNADYFKYTLTPEGRFSILYEDKSPEGSRIVGIDENNNVTLIASSFNSGVNVHKPENSACEQYTDTTTTAVDFYPIDGNIDLADIKVNENTYLGFGRFGIVSRSTKYRFISPHEPLFEKSNKLHQKILGINPKKAIRRYPPLPHSKTAQCI